MPQLTLCVCVSMQAYICKYMFICVHWCIQMCIDMNEHMCGSQSSTLDSFLYCFLPYFLRQDNSLNQKIADTARLNGTRFQGSACHCFLHLPSVLVTSMYHHSKFLHECGYSNSGLPYIIYFEGRNCVGNVTVFLMTNIVFSYGFQFD